MEMMNGCSVVVVVVLHLKKKEKLFQSQCFHSFRPSMFIVLIALVVFRFFQKRKEKEDVQHEIQHSLHPPFQKMRYASCARHFLVKKNNEHR